MKLCFYSGWHFFLYTVQEEVTSLCPKCSGWRIWGWNGKSGEMTHSVLHSVEVQWANDFWELQCLESVKDEFEEGIRSSEMSSIITFREQWCSFTFTSICLKFFLIFTRLIEQIGVLFVASCQPRQMNTSFLTYWYLVIGIRYGMWIWEVSILQVNLLLLWSQWFLCSLPTLTAHCWIKILKKAENCDCVCWEGIGQPYKDKEGERNKEREILQGKRKRKKVFKNVKVIFSMARNLKVDCHRISADTRVDKCIYSLSGEVAEKARWQIL